MPRLRGLLDPALGPGGVRRPRQEAARDRDHLGHRLQLALPVLHGDLRVPHDPRPRARPRDRRQAEQPRPRRVGDHRRRRRDVDRRQPLHPHDAAQRRPQGADVQQPHLRVDQGAVLADERAGQAHEVVTPRHGRPAVPAAVHRGGRRGDLRGAGDRSPQPRGTAARGIKMRASDARRLSRLVQKKMCPVRDERRERKNSRRSPSFPAADRPIDRSWPTSTATATSTCC